MRSDMAKVLCEEPRRGMRVKERKGYKRELARTALEDQPVKERGNLYQRWHAKWGDGKEFGDHVSPLKRFILSSCGRPWNEVYSDIRKVVKPGTVVNNHLYTHLYSYVTVNVVEKDGEFYDVSSRIYTPTFVHPETGILTRTAERKRLKAKRQRTERVIRLNENTAYARDKKGIWYECKLISLSKEKIKKKHYFSSRKNCFIYTESYLSYYDIFLKRHINFSDGFWRSPPAYCVSKRQMNKREIKKIEASRQTTRVRDRYKDLLKIF
jgi:hypothetical protein